MKYRGFRIDVVMALAILTLFVLVGGQTYYGRMFVERPFLEKLRAIPGIITVSMEKFDGKYDITFNLASGSNLPSVYRQISSLAQRSFGTDSFKLHITDKRTPALECLYRQMQLHIEEAVAQGNFSVVAERLKAIATQAGVQENFYVDEEYIYLELHQDKGYLYAVRHRILPKKEAEISI